MAQQVLNNGDSGLVARGKVNDNNTELYAHSNSTANPHSVTKTQVGLGNADNTSDVNKPVSTAQQTALNAKQATLVSATNIKTVNGDSLLGAGNLVVSGGGSAVPSFRGVYTPGTLVVLIGDSNTNGRTPGTGTPGGRPAYAFAFQNELTTSVDSLYYGCVIHNIAGNGSQIHDWKESITTGNQATNTSTDVASIVNVWAAKNILAAEPTKKGVIEVKLGTNDQWNAAFRVGVGVEATQLANFNLLIDWLIDNTSADIALIIPQPIAFGRGIALGDWPDQAAANESSRIIRATYLNCSKRDHPRVRMVDTHGGLWGTAITSTGMADYQTPSVNLFDDDLHLTSAGYRRETQYKASIIASGPRVPRVTVRSSPDQALNTAVWSETVYMASISDQGTYAIADIYMDPMFAVDGFNVDKTDQWPGPATQLQHLRSMRASSQFGSRKRLVLAGGATYRRMFCWCHNSGNVYSLGRLVASQDVIATTGYWYTQYTPEYQRDYAGVSGTAKFVAGDVGPVTFWVEDAQYAPYGRNETKLVVDLYAYPDLTTAIPVNAYVRHKFREDITDCAIYGFAGAPPSGGTSSWQMYLNGATAMLPAGIEFADGASDAVITANSPYSFAAGDFVQFYNVTNAGSGKGFHFQIIGKTKLYV